MPTIGDYVNETIESLRLPIGPVRLDMVFLNENIVKTSTLSLENAKAMDIAIVSLIPELLLVPDKRQGDTAITWDKDAIMNYYRLKTGELGLPNLLDDEEENSITDVSNIW